MDSPLISVVIPVYNGSNYMREAVDSVLAQTYMNYEILLIDDGSKDNTWEIIQEYVQKYPDKIRGFHKENGGVTTALNYGISEMNGEWFAWLSHDDLWDIVYLQKQIENISKHPECMVSYTGFMNIDADKNTIGINKPQWYPKGKAMRSMIVFGEYMNAISILINHRCFEEIGLFDLQWRYVQDTDMIFKLIKNYNTCCIYDPLTKRRVHQNQVGVTANKAVKKEQQKLFIYYDIQNSLHDYYPELLLDKHNHIKNILINTIGKFYYIKYVPYCHRHNLPVTFRHLVWRLIPKSLKDKCMGIYMSTIGKLNERVNKNE